MHCRRSNQSQANSSLTIGQPNSSLVSPINVLAESSKPDTQLRSDTFGIPSSDDRRTRFAVLVLIMSTSMSWRVFFLLAVGVVVWIVWFKLEFAFTYAFVAGPSFSMLITPAKKDRGSMRLLVEKALNMDADLDPRRWNFRRDELIDWILVSSPQTP